MFGKRGRALRIQVSLFTAILVLLILSSTVLANPAYISTKRPSTYFPENFDASKNYPEKEITLKAKKFSFNPNIVRVEKGDLVTIHLESTDVHHGIYIDGYGIEVDAVPGETGTLQFYADKSGRFTMRCSITCGDFHPYMVNYLVVGPNSRFTTFAGIALFFAIVNIFLVVRRKEEETAKPITIPVTSTPQPQQAPKKESFVKDGRIKIKLSPAQQPSSPKQGAPKQMKEKSNSKSQTNQQESSHEKGGINGTG